MNGDGTTKARRGTLLAGLAMCLAMAHAASAAPDTVGQRHDDTGSAVVSGSDGLTYQVSFELKATAGNPSQWAFVRVAYKACKRTGSCGFTYTYDLSLAANQVSFPDANTATVTTKLLGRPLTLRWSAHPATPAASFSVEANIPNTVAVGDPTSGGTADFTATFFGFSCGGRGEVSNAYGAFAAPAPESSSHNSRIPAGFATKHGHKPGCQSGD
jgi:hypothetical protein